jgi:HEPN domain-containing protein
MRYVLDADYFFITYALACLYPLQNHLFLIGHAVELYLKAIFIKQTDDEIAAMKFGHNIRGLFDACQNKVPPFLT